MSEPIERAIARADLICVTLEPAYAPTAGPLRTLVTAREASRLARLAQPHGGLRYLWEEARLVLLPPGEGPVAGFLPPVGQAVEECAVDATAMALHFQAVAADQGSRLLRLRIALSVMLSSGHGEAIGIVRKWFEGGGTGPIPYPEGALFKPWAEANGIANVDGFMGLRVKAELSPNGERRRG